jgi:hypothetical protein
MIVGVTSKVQLEPSLQDAMYAFGTSTVQLRLRAFYSISCATKNYRMVTFYIKKIKIML